VHWTFTKFVLTVLSKEQKENCFSVCQDLQERFERDPEFLLKIITCDETRVLGYKVETNQQLSLWKSHHLHAQKVKISLLKYEEHAYCFFEHYQSCAYIFVPKGQTANKHWHLFVGKCAAKTTWEVEFHYVCAWILGYKQSDSCFIPSAHQM